MGEGKERVEREPLDHHGGTVQRGMAVVPRSSSDEGRFGRLFRTLAPFAPTDAQLATLASSMTPPAGLAADPSGDNPDIPAGYTYLGQFVDHDITFDPVSVLERGNDPDALSNFRTPRFDLDSRVRGRTRADPVPLRRGRPRQAPGRQEHGGRIEEPTTCPANQQGRALIGDPRNDVHVISPSSLGLPAVPQRRRRPPADAVVPDADHLDEAQRLTRWHYQWVVSNDFLAAPRRRRRCSTSVLAARPGTGGRQPDLAVLPLEERNPSCRWSSRPRPTGSGTVEIRSTYVLNDGLNRSTSCLRPPTPTRSSTSPASAPFPRGGRIQWDLYFVIDGSSPQLSRRIDAKLTGPPGQAAGHRRRASGGRWPCSTCCGAGRSACRRARRWPRPWARPAPRPGTQRARRRSGTTCCVRPRSDRGCCASARPAPSSWPRCWWASWRPTLRRTCGRPRRGRRSCRRHGRRLHHGRLPALRRRRLSWTGERAP